MSFFKPSQPQAGKILQPNKNCSDRIRDHLANERTYLAWMRGAIALMGFGVLIIRIRMLHPPLSQSPGRSWKLGLMFAIVGLITVLLSTQHYFAVRRDIEDDEYRLGDRWIILFSLTVLILGTGVIYYVFTAPAPQTTVF